MKDTTSSFSIDRSTMRRTTRRTFLRDLGAVAMTAGMPAMLARNANAIPLANSTCPVGNEILKGLSGSGSKFLQQLAQLYRGTSNQPLVDKWVDEIGMRHCSINMYWAKECEPLPCFRGISFPQYAEQIVLAELTSATSAGKKVPIIIHLWKGYCPKFYGKCPTVYSPKVQTFWDPTYPATSYAGDQNFPGGFGVEIGVYRWLSQEQVASRYQERNMLPNSIWRRSGGREALDAIQTSLYALKKDERWYPASELKANIRFRLRDPQNGDVWLIDSEERKKFLPGNYVDPKDYFWCTEWILFEDYINWGRTRPQWWARQGTGVIDATRLLLEWEITGVGGDKIGGIWSYRNGDTLCGPLIGCAGDGSAANFPVSKRRTSFPNRIDTPWPAVAMQSLSPATPPQGPPRPGLLPDPTKQRICKALGNC